MNKINNIVEFYKNNHNIMSIENLFSDKKYGTLPQYIEIFYIYTKNNKSQKYENSLINKRNSYIINKILKTHEESINIDEIQKIILMSANYIEDIPMSVNNVIENVVKYYDGYYDDIVDFILENEKLDKLYSKYTKAYIDLLYKASQFSKHPKIYIKKLEEIYPDKAEIAKELNIYYNPNELIEKWNRMTLKELNAYIDKIRIHIYNPKFIDYLIEKRLINKNISDRTISIIIKRFLIGVGEDYGLENIHFHKRKEFIEFVDKYHYFIFGKYMVGNMRCTQRNLYNIFKLFNELFKRNSYVTSAELLDYITRNETFSYEYYNYKLYNNYDAKRLIIDTFMNVERLKNEIAQEKHIEFQKYLNHILDIIEYEKTIPTKYMLIADIFININQLFEERKYIDRYGYTNEEINDLFFKLIGKNTIKRILKINIKLNIKMIKKYDDVIKSIKEKNILQDHIYPGYVIVNSTKFYINADTKNIIYKNKYIQKTINEIISAFIFRNNESKKIFKDHDFSTFISNISNKNILTKIEWIFGSYHSEKIIPILLELLKEDEQLLKKLREVLIKFLKISTYFNLFNGCYDYMLVSIDSGCIISLFKYLQKYPELIKLLLDDSHIDIYGDIIVDYVDNTLTHFYKLNFDLNKLIEILTNTIEEYKEKEEYKESIDIITKFKSYLQLCTLSYMI